MTLTKMTDQCAPCFLCGSRVEIKYSKREKPYLVCNSCGIQVFIRGQRGISLLEKWKNAPLTENQTPVETSEILNLVSQLDKLKITLKNTEANEEFWTLFSDNPATEAIKSEIKRVENRLRELSENQ